MTKEELQLVELESFKKDFDELFKKHEQALDTLGIGISISGGIHRVHYKGKTYAISNQTAFNVEQTTDWYD